MSATATLAPGYRLLAGHPTVPEYVALRRKAGLTPKTTAQARASITGSWYACYVVYADPSGSPGSLSEAKSSTTPATGDVKDSEEQTQRHEGEVAVAMGRVIGDGGWYFHIVDMAVLPTHQAKGLGIALMATMLYEIRTRSPPGAYVNLIASVVGQKLYSKFGFVETVPHVGMHLMMSYPEGQGPQDEIIDKDE